MTFTPRRGAARRGPLTERFWRAVEKAEGDGCWLWAGSLNTWGYGQIRDEAGKYQGAHRVSWRLAFGPVPQGMSVLHRCDNTRCVRPDHLFLGTQQENVRDRNTKGRDSRGSRHPNATLTEEQVLAARAMLANGDRIGVVARRFGVGYYAIADISRGRSWKHVRGVA